jgi:hypothetical protein
MANVPLHYSATLQDGLTRRKSTDVYENIVDTTTLATLALSLGTWLTDLDAITDGAIVESHISINPARPGGLKTVGTGTTFLASRVAQIGIFRFSVAGTTASWSSDVPSLSDAAITGDNINLAVAATYTALLGGGAAYTNPQNQALIALTKTLVRFRKSN